MPLAASAQFDFGGGAKSAEDTKPWAGFKLNPKTRIKLNFPNSSVDAVLSLFEKQSGVTIVKDPSLTGAISITSATPVSLSDAFDILQTNLSLKGYNLQKQGKLLVIRKADDRGRTGGFDPSLLTPGQPGPETPDTELRVYQLQYASATQVAKVLTDVFAPDATTPTNPFGNFGRFNRGNGGGFGGRRGGFQLNIQNGAAPQFAFNQRGPALKASADDFSNSVIVNATAAEQLQVADLIKSLDKETDQPQRTALYKLTYANASDVATVIQNVLASNVPRGRGQSTATTQGGGGGFRFPFFGGGGGNSGQTQVSADTRTNSVVVTTTEDNQKIVEGLVKQLDTEIPVQSATFVIPLSNAKSDDVAATLTQAFGQRQGVTNNTRTNTNTSRTPTTSSNSSSNRSSNTNSRAESQSDKELTIDLADPNAESGDLATNVSVSQGFGGFQFRGGGGNNNNSSNQSQTTTARDAEGHVINVRDLTGQVTIISDPNTNSLIVVAPPDGAQLIKNIVSQLDQIPQQVMIETIIVEAELDKTDQLGVAWKYTGSLGRLLGDPTATGTSALVSDAQPSATNNAYGLQYTISSKNLAAFINALHQDDRYRILSTPRIFTSNNVQSDINISQQLPYVLSSTVDSNGNTNYTYGFENVGVILTVNPHITSNGYVSLDVSQTANDFQAYTSFNAPIVNQREADTNVSVKDGETIVIGGIMRTQVTSSVKKIPLLGDIPLLGNLFRSTSKENQKTELLVFLTPHIVRNADDARQMRQQTTNELSPETQKGLQEVLPPVGPINNGTPKGKGGG